MAMASKESTSTLSGLSSMALAPADEHFVFVPGRKVRRGQLPVDAGKVVAVREFLDEIFSQLGLSCGSAVRDA